MPILNYTTTISAAKTATEVGAILVKAKVASTSTHYDANGDPEGVSFTLNTPHGPREFRLPVNVDGVYAVMKADKSLSGRHREREQSVRVAWRIAKDWVEAQVALVQAGMVTIDEVMLPYLVGVNGQTLYTNYRASEQAALDV